MVDTKVILWNFVKNLKNRMTTNGVGNRQVAYASRITSGTMPRYKSGACFPQLWTLVLISDYLDCSVDEMLGYSKPCTFARTRRQVPAMERFPNWDIFADYFRERLIKMMEVKKLSREELSELAGASARTIDIYLSIHRWVPDTPSFLRICDALDCTPSDLLGY